MANFKVKIKYVSGQKEKGVLRENELSTFLRMTNNEVNKIKSLIIKKVK